MLMSRDEIIADIQAQIRKCGGDSRDWSAGTAKDSHGALFTRHETEDLRDGWIYREAFTPGVARDVQDYFVAQCGTGADASGEDEAGRLVSFTPTKRHLMRSSHLRPRLGVPLPPPEGNDQLSHKTLLSDPPESGDI